MNTPTAELRSRNLRTLAILAGLFVVPLLVSFWAYYATDWRPAGHSNHGELILPARPLPHVDLPRVAGEAAGGSLFKRKWTLVYLGGGNCDDACRRALYFMRQTRLGLNNEMTRVERVFLVTGSCCDRQFLGTEHAGLDVFDASGPAASNLLAQFPSTDRENSLFVVDPLGNLMMRYDDRLNPKGLLQDLQKLLRLSHIG
jgi:cytochrome oxidase Cu insertion factor (SCO1/SenC/PrrC family)